MNTYIRAIEERE